MREDYGIRRSALLNGLSLGGWVRRYDIENLGGLVQFYDNLMQNLKLHYGLYMAGKMVIPVGQSDSDVLVGFYHAEAFENSTSIFPPTFAGVHIGGNSKDGILFEPMVIDNGKQKVQNSPDALYRVIPGQYILNFRVAFYPKKGLIEVSINDQNYGPYPLDHDLNIEVDRFGLLPIRSGGSPMEIYLDELTYSFR